jgi:hypothetical protein
VVGRLDNDIVRRGRWVREHLLGGRAGAGPANQRSREDRMDDLGTPFEYREDAGGRLSIN